MVGFLLKKMQAHILAQCRKFPAELESDRGQRGDSGIVGNMVMGRKK